MNIPNDILLHIFTFIPSHTFYISRGCKLFKQILDERTCYNTHLIQNDSHLLVNYLLETKSIGYEFYVKTIHNYNCMVIMANNLNYITKNPLLHDLAKLFCKVNNVSAIKYFKNIIMRAEREDGILTSWQITKLCGTALHNKNYAIADYLLFKYWAEQKYCVSHDMAAYYIMRNMLCDNILNKLVKKKININNGIGIFNYLFVNGHMVASQCARYLHGRRMKLHFHNEIDTIKMIDIISTWINKNEINII